MTPFRWVEVEGWPTELHADQIRRRAAFDSTWVDDAATFHSSDPMLDKVWDLCHYSIKATTFAGVFVDGDRERLAYEADAYLTQLSYYAGDADPRIAASHLRSSDEVSHLALRVGSAHGLHGLRRLDANRRHSLAGSALRGTEDQAAG